MAAGVTRRGVGRHVVARRAERPTRRRRGWSVMGRVASRPPLSAAAPRGGGDKEGRANGGGFDVLLLDLDAPDAIEVAAGALGAGIVTAVAVDGEAHRGAPLEALQRTCAQAAAPLYMFAADEIVDAETAAARFRVVAPGAASPGRGTPALVAYGDKVDPAALGAAGVVYTTTECRVLLAAAQAAASPNPDQEPEGLEEQAVDKSSRLRGAIALIAGGTVGAGIIALPVKTAAAGFMPSAVLLVAAWAYMCVTALCLVELSVHFGPGTNLVTMAKKTLGKPGVAVTLGLYLFIYLATLTAYIAEGANLARPLIAALPGIVAAPPSWATCGTFAAGLGAFVYAGTGPTERLNSVCLAVAIAAYVALVAIGFSSISGDALLRASWPSTLRTLPIMVVAFTFHNMVPSLLPYLGSARQVVRAVVMGSAFPLGLYLLWQFIILGSLQDTSGLQSSAHVIAGLRAAAGPVAERVVQVFSLFAIVTSFLGVALGCVDFIADLLFGGRKTPPPPLVKRGVPLAVALVLPIIVAVTAPTIFLPALEFSGTFRLVLFALLPAAMVWRARYDQGFAPWLKGGRILLLAVAAGALFVMGSEWGGRLGLFVVPP